MPNRRILGLFKEDEAAANAADALRTAGYTDENMEFLTGSPYPEGAFGEHVPAHKLYVFPLIGAVCGFGTALLITIGTQLGFPLVTGGKPILGIPPMMIIMYEGTMLAAIIFTVIGIIFESRLPRFGVGLYDPRIMEGYVGVLVNCAEERLSWVDTLMRQSGAEDVKVEEPLRR